MYFMVSDDLLEIEQDFRIAFNLGEKFRVELSELIHVDKTL